MWGIAFAPTNGPPIWACSMNAGFTFRTNVAPPREFIWNQTAWVETTPQPQTLWASNIDALGFNLSNAGKTRHRRRPYLPSSTQLAMRLQLHGYGCARFSGSLTSVSESGIHIVNTSPAGRDYAFWSTGSGSSPARLLHYRGLRLRAQQGSAGLRAARVGIGGLTSSSFQCQLAIDLRRQTRHRSIWSVASDTPGSS